MTLNDDLFHKLFPFYFALDSKLQVIECGKSFEKLFGDERSFTKLFSFLRPGIGITYEFESIKSFSGQMFILDSKTTQHPLKLKGGFVYTHDTSSLLFCGSPWILNERELELNNLKTHDFGFIDSQIDVIQVNQMNIEMTNELMTLNKSLANQKNFYEEILNNVPADVAVFSPEYKFLFVNKNAVKNDELRKWLIGKSEMDYWKSKNKPIDLAEKRIEGFNHAVTAKSDTTIEEVINEGELDEKTFLRITHPYFKNDNLMFLLNYGVEVTDLKKNRDALKQKNTELTKLNSELDSFVYSASHNLRSPLTSLKGITNLLLSQKLSPEENLFFIESIIKTIDKLDATIIDIIDYSRNSRMDMQLSIIDMEALAKQSFSEMEFINLSVNFSIECDNKAVFTSDRKRITSLLDNIISNSLKYSDGSKVTSYLKIKIEINEQHCLIKLEDNGIGMSEEALANAFKMFYRGTNKDSGSGLGLFIVKEILKKIEGSINMDSKIGLGTTTIITLKNLKQ
ncbi:MAG: ATP-binding protein [Bacteroidota bacterium]